MLSYQKRIHAYITKNKDDGIYKQFSKIKEFWCTLHTKEISLAKEMAQKIETLQIMPV